MEDDDQKEKQFVKKKKKSAIRKYGKYVVAGIAGKRQSMDYSFVHCSIKKF